MLFMGQLGRGVLIRAWVGALASGTVTMRFLGADGDDTHPGVVLTPTAKSTTGVAAEYDLSTAIISSWAASGDMPLHFGVTLEAFSVSGAAKGWLSVSQVGGKLRATEGGDPLNGAAGPFRDVELGQIASGSVIIRPFGIGLQ